MSIMPTITIAQPQSATHNPANTSSTVQLMPSKACVVQRHVEAPVTSNGRRDILLCFLTPVGLIAACYCLSLLVNLHSHTLLHKYCHYLVVCQSENRTQLMTCNRYTEELSNVQTALKKAHLHLFLVEATA